jgi:hypothetical protein
MDNTGEALIKHLDFEVTLDTIYSSPKYIFYRGEWAEIISLPEIKQEECITNITPPTIKKQYDLSTTITRAVKEDNPNLIFEEAEVEDIRFNDTPYSCLFNKTGLSNKLKCSGLRCKENNCPFLGENTTVESATKWLYRDRKKLTSNQEISEVKLSLDNIEIPQQTKATKQKFVRTIPKQEKLPKTQIISVQTRKIPKI